MIRTGDVSARARRTHAIAIAAFIAGSTQGWAGQTNHHAVRANAASAGLFFIEAVGADVLIHGSKEAIQPLSHWTTFAELRSALSSWTALSVSGATGEALFKVGYGTMVLRMPVGKSISAELRLAGRPSLAGRAVSPRAAIAGRVIPLWIALMGAQLMEAGTVSASGAVVEAANVLAAHAAVTSAALVVKRGYQVFRYSLGGIKQQARLTFSLPELIALGIVESTIIHGLEEMEKDLLDREHRSALLDNVTDRVQEFHRTSFSDLVHPAYEHKRIEWQSRYRDLAVGVAAYCGYDLHRLEIERKASHEAVRTVSRGSFFRGPVSASETSLEHQKIEALYERKRRALESQLQQRAQTIKLPLHETADLKEILKLKLQPSPSMAFDQIRQIVEQTLVTMEQRWMNDLTVRG